MIAFLSDIIRSGKGKLQKYKRIIRSIINAYKKKDIVSLICSIEKLDPIDIVIFSAILGKNSDIETGRTIGLSLGNETNEFYLALPLIFREFWESERWLHHGALGELLIIRGKRKNNPFLIGLGKGLQASDLNDRDRWHSSEYFQAKDKLQKMK